VTAATRALDVALGLGVPAFPCRSDKAPACPRGFKDATSRPDTLQDLWQRHPGSLVGMPTGTVSNIDVFDLDSKHPEAAEWWSKNRHRLPRTRVHRTRSGGLHLVFRHLPNMRCWTGRPVPGIDGRGDGGYVIWWPAAGLPVLCDAPTAAWPEWLLIELQPPPSLARSTYDPDDPHARCRSASRVTIPDSCALASLVRRVAGASEGERNAIAFWAACRAGEMAASGLLGAGTAAAVIAHAAILSGLPQAEAERTARSGVRTGLGNAAHA
jgi:hypothetical protein